MLNVLRSISANFVLFGLFPHLNSKPDVPSDVGAMLLLDPHGESKSFEIVGRSHFM